MRDKPGFLHRLTTQFVGGQMSLEGDLSKCKFAENLVAAQEDFGILKRITLYPRQDFVVLRLERKWLNNG